MKKKYLAVILLLLINSYFCFAKEKFSWDFSDCEIKDVLYAISLDSGFSICADDTVNGKCDFRFSGNSFEKAFDSFLSSTRLFASERDGVINVSRFYFEKKNEVYYAECSSLKPSVVFEKLGKAMSQNITFDLLPSYEISFHLNDNSEKRLIENILKFLPGFSVNRNEVGFHISKSESKNVQDKKVVIKETEKDKEKIHVEIKNVSFFEAVEDLFKDRGKDFCFLTSNDAKASRSVFDADSFDEALDFLCAQNGFESDFSDNIYYIYSKPEKKEELINGKREWVYFPLKYLSSEKIIPLVSRRFSKGELTSGNGEYGFWANVTQSQQSEIRKMLEFIDVEKKTFLIQLKNTKSAEMIKRLPSTIDKNTLSDADGNCGLYFTGTEEAYEKILKEIELCDKKQIRLKYDLLVLQYDQTSDFLWSSNMNVRNLQKGDVTSAATQLGSVLGFNVNVVSAFGLDFAAALQTSITENKTKVFADTSLYGLAGKEINFTNTNTYRYRDNNLDPETGKPVYTGVTREIVSGLKIDVSGWVGDDGNITTSVKASVTRRGTDTSSVNGNPPPTSEKLVTTEVCSKSGEPVILSGLLSESEGEDTSRTPLLSKVPVLGKLFEGKSVTKEKSQMVIVLVPNIETETAVFDETEKTVYTPEWAEERMEELCRIMTSN